MARLSVIALLLLAAAVIIKSNVGSESKEIKAIKLNGLSIPKPKAKAKAKTAEAKPKPLSPRRVVSSQPVVLKAAPVVQQRVPIQALEPAQKITRAQRAWENIRAKALDRLGVDQGTRERLDELYLEYKLQPSSMKHSDYVRSVKDLLGEEDYVFLYNAREEFKSRVYDRAQIEIGPHIGAL